jgi:hypothetical protein
MLPAMETPDELKRRARCEQHLLGRLQLAAAHLADVKRGQVWAIVAPHQAGLSIRQIATGTQLSPSRVHQLLNSEEARILHATFTIDSGIQLCLRPK